MKHRPQHDDSWTEARHTMMDDLRLHGIRDRRVLAAMEAVPRHRFIPEQHDHGSPYGDYPVPIGHGQTISQPFIVAYMTARLAVVPGDRILEIGTGSGYQTAVLAELGAEVFSVEIVPELAGHARRVLDKLGYGKVTIRLGSGYEGWPENAPYQAIIGTCCAPELPVEPTRQLADGGRMIIPVGTDTQRLLVVTKDNGTLNVKDDLWVRFVPMLRP